jgi:hypothetical protein
LFFFLTIENIGDAQVDYTELRTVKQLALEAPFLTENKLRWWIFHADQNGLKPALIKISGRIYIDRTEFNKWLESQRMAPKPNRAA